MPKWTKEQMKAINSDGTNIIVSAGAGSGKTAVLTERVIRKLEDGIGIDKLLILTFTKAAASEMKRRIRNEIKKRIELSDDLKKIDSSYITTFDSFSLSLVRKYHYLLNVKRDINIIDNNLLKIKTNEYLDEVMEEEYQNNSDDFSKLINGFCIKDDKDIKKTILSINDKLNMKYDKRKFLENYIDNFYSNENINKNKEKYLYLLKEIIKDIDNNLTNLSNEVDLDFFNEISKLLSSLINSNTYEEIKESTIISLPRLPRESSENAKIFKEKVKKDIDNIKLLTRYQDTDELIKSIKLTREYVKSIIRIILKLDDKINNYKFTNDLYDFVDISKMAIKLVKENRDIKEEVKSSFNEIMVDEYQDTSDLQEEFINLISNNNVYMVGDIKQSIYRFRNANPDIFRNKYNLYSKESGGIRIDLLNNFRSRGEVVDGINLIFSYVMSEFIGGADYKNYHQMLFGNTSYLKEGKVNQNNNLELYSYSYDNNMPYTKDEIEAFIIADDINEKIANHFQVFDKEEKKLRDTRFSDFTILIDRSTSFDLYKKIFLYKKIPLSIYQDEKLSNSELFSCIKSIFKLINLVYDRKFDKELEYAYLSIGRSFLFNFTDQELFDTITTNNYQETTILKKINNIINNIDSKSISMILDDIINEFNIYEKLRGIPNINSNYVKIEYLYTLAYNLNNMGYSFLDFNKYLDDLLENDNDIKFSINKEDSVGAKIMTIHASKGLEYPICYFPGLSKKINDDEIKGRILYNNLLGIVIPYNHDGIDYTFYRELLKNDYYKDEISEKIRLLYVALTRAREKMIFILPDTINENEEYQDEILNDNDKLNYRSFLDILTSIKSKLLPYIKTIDLKKINLTKNYNLINSDNLFNNLKKINDKIEIKNIAKKEVIKKSESHFSKNSLKVFSKAEKEKMEFGTKMHYYLEMLDLKNPSLSEIDSIYKEKVEAFLNCDLIKNIDKARVYQEYEFIDNSLDEEKHGIIDLMLEYDDHIDIIDYKLKNINDEAYFKQLNGYRNYIKKISNKNIFVYLYSIIDSVYQKVGE